MEQEPGINSEKRLTHEVPFMDGQEVVVKRTGKNGQPATFEGGWRVDSFNEETGRYKVVRYDQEEDIQLEKSISATDLTSYQPNLEPEVNLETPAVDYSNFAPQPDIFKKPPTSESKPELITGVPDFAVEAAHSTIDWEPVPINEAVEDLAELATEQVVADPSDAESHQATSEQSPKLTQQEYLNKMTEGLSDEDKDALEEYATAVAAERRTRLNGESDNVRYWYAEQQKQSAKMSAEAQNIAKRYAEATVNYFAS